MFELIIGGVIGLVVGWFFFPAPKFITDLYAKWFGDDNTPVA